MRLIVCILTLCILWSACKKENNNDDALRIPEGAYAGTFTRTGMSTAHVTINFGQNAYDGESDTDKYPAICHGSFNLSGNLIVFADSCAWTANFDWSLILNGTYSISFQDDGIIRIWRTSGNITDEYLLRKLQR
jgi:hypothetical protein